MFPLNNWIRIATHCRVNRYQDSATYDRVMRANLVGRHPQYPLKSAKRLLHHKQLSSFRSIAPVLIQILHSLRTVLI
jgi:hypothetical protein